MNNLVKIILGINIAVGGLGAIFAFSKKGKVGNLKTAKETAETAAQTARNNETKFKKGLDTATKDLSMVNSTVARLTNQLNNLSGNAASAKAAIDQANIQLAAAQGEAAQAKSDMQSLQTEANKVQGLEATVAQYNTLGTPQDIRTKLQRLAQLEAGAPKPKPKAKPKAVAGGEVGTIINFDQGFGFYTINRGTDVGIKNGDKFTIYRGGQAIGKIVIKRVNPTVSIANYDPAFPKPPMPFKVGDKVMKVN